MVRYLVLLALAVPAYANVGRGRGEGAHLAEPGGLREIAIEHEDLRFDLRPLVGGDGLARVSATYHLDHRGAAPVAAELVFVGGGPMTSFDVALDGKPLASTDLDDARVAMLPPSWRTPASTPAIDGNEAPSYATTSFGASAFHVDIAPGKHELAVTYRALPQWVKSPHSATKLHQLAYVLAPARDWGSFGTLDVTVEVPADWRVATSWNLPRTGDTLRAHYTSLPADTFGITLQARAGVWHAILKYALPPLALLVLVGGGFVMFRIGRARRRKSDDLRPLWPTSLPASIVWAFAIAVSGGYAAMSQRLALPEGESAARGYGPALGILLACFIGLVAIPAGVLIARAGNRGSDTSG